MLDGKFIKQNPDEVKKAIANRGEDPAVIDRFLEYEAERKELLSETESLRHKRNVVSAQVARMKQKGENADELIAAMREVSSKIKELNDSLSEMQARMDSVLLGIPNTPHESVPTGTDESDNPTLRKHGTIPDFDFQPRAHWEIGESLGILDFKRAAKIAGARFPLYVGAGALMERALINFMLDIHTVEHGYTECLPPFMVNEKTMTGTGQLPKFEEDLFKLEKWGYYLIPTAEVPVTNIHRDEVLNDADLPIRYTAYTPCFRSEAGSYGKDTKGLIRQHQFNKVELVKFTLPEQSYDELELLLADAETILKKLDLPYRVVTLCTGDLGFSAAKTYDIEVWFPAQNRYREISSCSNFEDFQARRANIRFKRQGQKGTEFVHTLNGSGLAVGRTVAAILENCQQADGSVEIPEALRPYMRGMDVILP
ncbi:MAG: serine--tRNA ligase [Desulfococcus sp. 4484_241]|nr:MAG: serine--tRNA ligase [Desulfococcus sp. 4484_241]